MIISSRAPTRISFAGGGTDVEPYASAHGGAVLNAAIAKYNYTVLTPSDAFVLRSPEYLTGITVDPENIQYDKRLDLLKAAMRVMLKKPAVLTIFSEAQYRSGLGSSGSAFVSVLSAIAAYSETRLSGSECAELAWRIERDELGNPGGRQDQYAAAYGGFNYLEFEAGEVVVNSLRLDRNMVLELEKRILLAYVAPRAASGGIIEQQTRNVQEGRAETLQALHRSKELARAMKRALLRNSVKEMAALLREAWEEKKKLAAGITTGRIDELYAGALAHGALAGKISGAGGGGYMFFIAEEGRELDLYSYLREQELHPEFVKFDFQGCTVWPTY